jgi:hypothetical protein
VTDLSAEMPFVVDVAHLKTEGGRVTPVIGGDEGLSGLLGKLDGGWWGRLFVGWIAGAGC